MKNLAGVSTCDADIAKELLEAGIHMETILKTNTEVPYTVVGVYGGWTFTRAWTYWVAEYKHGLNPVVANLINKRWRNTIRVDGFAGGKDVDNEPVKDYHIDTQAGLNAFVKAIAFDAIL